jgi:hypothetical protein
MEKEKGSDKREQRFRMTGCLCLKFFDRNGWELREEEKDQINNLGADEKDEYMALLRIAGR